QQNSQQPKHFRGGEKKVMKKSLSLLVAIAMVFSMFATMASAQTLTTEDKYEALKQAGIFEGFEDGSAGLDQEMTRAQFAKVLALTVDLGDQGSKSYSDVAASHWAAGYIAAVSDAGLMEGIGNGKFDPNGDVTIEQLAATVVRALGLD